MKLREDIKPVTYMKTRAEELLRDVKRSRRPVRRAVGPLTGDPHRSSIITMRLAIGTRRERAIPLLIVTGLACGTCGGCATTQLTSIRPTGEVLEAGAQSWRNKARPEDQVVIDDLAGRKDLMFHIIMGSLAGEAARGSASSPAASDFAKRFCLLHPKIAGIRPERDWDIIYDPKQSAEFAKTTGIPNPVEVLLHHEVFGHILPVLRDPNLLKTIPKDERLREENERAAVEEENRYRRHLGLPEVTPGRYTPVAP